MFDWRCCNPSSRSSLYYCNFDYLIFIVVVKAGFHLSFYYLCYYYFFCYCCYYCCWRYSIQLALRQLKGVNFIIDIIITAIIIICTDLITLLLINSIIIVIIVDFHLLLIHLLLHYHQNSSYARIFKIITILIIILKHLNHWLVTCWNQDNFELDYYLDRKC